MQQCYSNISETDMVHMFLQAPEIIRIIRTDGRVTDVQLDELGICKLPGNMHINRDDLVTWRQHAHVLSHAASKEKFVDYLLMRNERNDPALQQQRKLQEQAAKVIQRATAAQEKAEKAIREKASKVAEKVAEKERRSALSAADRSIEDGAKKLEMAQRKAAKTLEAEQRLRAAQEVAAQYAAPLHDVPANDESDD